MPTGLADTQVDILWGKYQAARGVVDEFPETIPKSDAIFRAVENGFDEIEETQELYARAYDQEPEAKATFSLYEDYLRAIGDVALTCEALETELVALDLNRYQRETPNCRYITFADELSAELKNAYDLEITTIPVVWDGFEIYPLDENLPETGELSHTYVMVLPRSQTEPEVFAPIIAHELAHAVLDRHEDLRAEFNSAIWEMQDRTRLDPDDRTHFARSWRAWFEELFCDACGILTFGPAYLSSLVRYLVNWYPYHIEGDLDSDLHPPDALRYEVVLGMAEEYFPELVDDNRDDQIAYDRHLRALEHTRPRNYDSYDYDYLRDFIPEEVPSAVTHDLDALIDDIHAGVDPEESQERSLRLAVNQFWLEANPS